ncbi:MAG: beta-ketoacyl-[acyl-carrier-protein] synthase II [Candidatus Marinimicrobia bacterium]|nr:beta-ketoacyl-[acyl-carrier-protein] synthase II [Candidatus Neomarinimicrobiota bacterium]
MLSRRVVITGVGVVSPIGNNVSDFNNSLKNGVNGINDITLFDKEKSSIKIAAEVKNLDFNSFIDKKELNKMDRFTQFAVIASDQAIESSNLNSYKSLDKERVGVIIGSGIGGISTLTEQHIRLQKSPKRVSPFFIPSLISDIAAGHVSIKYGFKGPNYGLVSACATGTHAIGDAYRMIQYGDSDVIITGGTEASVHPLAVAGFANMRALSKNPNYNDACRPFDLNRDGFVLGEGSGVIVLEEYEHALKRNANILCEIVGYAATGDAFHLTSPAPNGEGAARSMQLALNDAKISCNSIDYINAHGTSTPYNDKFETAAIRSTFKNYADTISISSTKSMTGHLLGAAGAVEAISCILSIKNGYVPPTINYHTPDPDCNLNYTPNKLVYKDIDYAMSNTFGFGGHNSTIIFKKK